MHVQCVQVVRQLLFEEDPVLEADRCLVLVLAIFVVPGGSLTCQLGIMFRKPVSRELVLKDGGNHH